MQEKYPRGEAERLLNDPVLCGILEDMKLDAFEVMASTADDKERALLAERVRTLTEFREELMTLSQGKTTLSKKRRYA